MSHKGQLEPSMTTGGKCNKCFMVLEFSKTMKFSFKKTWVTRGSQSHGNWWQMQQMFQVFCDYEIIFQTVQTQIEILFKVQAEANSIEGQSRTNWTIQGDSISFFSLERNKDFNRTLHKTCNAAETHSIHCDTLWYSLALMCASKNQKGQS